MQWQNFWRTCAVGAAAGLTLGLAQAGGVYWSVGVNSPGVAVGVGNQPMVMVAPPVVYAQPAVRYYAQPPVYGVAYAQVPMPGWGYQRRHHHRHHDRDEWRDQRRYHDHDGYRGHDGGDNRWDRRD